MGRIDQNSEKNGNKAGKVREVFSTRYLMQLMSASFRAREDRPSPCDFGASIVSTKGE